MNSKKANDQIWLMRKALFALASVATLCTVIYSFHSFFSSISGPCRAFYVLMLDPVLWFITLWMIFPYVLLMLMGHTKKIRDCRKALFTIFVTACVVVLLHLVIFADAIIVNPEPKSDAALLFLPMLQFVIEVVGLCIAVFISRMTSQTNKQVDGIA